LIIPPTAKFSPLSAFFMLKIMSSAEILRELCAVYNQNEMNEGTVRQWCRKFKDGRANKCSG
jgi:hypothetical protein